MVCDLPTPSEVALEGISAESAAYVLCILIYELTLTSG